MSDETKMDAEDINELRRIQTEMNKCYQRAKETEKQMDWHIWNDMLEVWYSKCADSGEGLLRTIDALTAERDAARAELATLREACGGAADGIERTATHGVENETKREWLRQKAKKIRAALESEGVR